MSLKRRRNGFRSGSGSSRRKYKYAKLISKAPLLIKKAKSAWRRSKTKLKSKSNRFTQVKQNGSSSWTSSCTMGRYRNSIPKDMKGQEGINYYEQNTERIVDTLGKQAISGDIYNLYLPYDIARLAGGLSGLPPYNVPQHMYIKSAVMKMIGTNSTDIMQSVTIYNVVARKDAPITHSAGSLWTQGYADQGEATTNALTYGATPYDANRFCSYYKIWKVTNHTLGAGESFIHTTYVNPNRSFNMLKIAEINNNTAPTAIINKGGFEGLSHYCVVTIKSGPVHDATTSTVVSSAAAAMDILTYKKYVSYPMGSLKPRFSAESANTVFVTSLGGGSKQEQPATATVTTVVS